MVLFFSSGEPIEQIPLSDILSIYSSNIQSIGFSETEIISPIESNKLLYVHQGEIACNIPDGLFDIIGSDDATTCHILFARSQQGCLSLITHIDSPRRVTGLKHFLEDLVLKDSEDLIDIYISGGIDQDETSLEVTQAIIDELAECSTNCYLRVLCTGKLNSINKRGKFYPRTLGSGFVSNSSLLKMGREIDHESSMGGRFVPVRFASPIQRGPAYLLRRALMSISENNEFLRVVFDGTQCLRPSSPSESPERRRHIVRVPHFHSDMDPTGARWFLSLPEPSFLANTSTSPHCEPPHFVSEMRELFSFLLNQQAIDQCFRVPSSEREPETQANETEGEGEGGGEELYRELIFELNEEGSWGEYHG